MVQRGDEGGLVEDGATRDVEQEAAFVLFGRGGGVVGQWGGGGEGRGRAVLGEDAEFGGGEEVRCRWGEREGDDEDVEVLREEGVERGLGCAAEPGAGDGPVGVAGVRDDVAFVGARGGVGSWRGGIG